VEFFLQLPQQCLFQPLERNIMKVANNIEILMFKGNVYIIITNHLKNSWKEINSIK